MAMTMDGSGITFNDSSTQISGKAAAKAWITFTGAATPTVHKSFNISSVTRNSSGKHTLNFPSPGFSDSTYCVVACASDAGAVDTQAQVGGTQTSTAVNIFTAHGTGVGDYRTYVVIFSDNGTSI